MPKGVWGIWPDVPEPTRSQLKQIYLELREEHGLPTRQSRRYARLVAEIWHASEQVSQETAKLAGARKHGKGRRPTSQKIRLLVKRQALQANTLDVALSKLAAMVKQHQAAKLARFPRRVV